MKKQIFLIAAAAIVMVSCSVEDTTSVNKGRSIDFRTAMGTRATEITTSSLDEIYVTALSESDVYFADVAFTKAEGASTYSSDPAYYWPSDDSELSFYAYYPSASDLNANVTVNSSTKTIADFSPASDISNQVDFISAYATGSKSASESNGVGLVFDHQLSQIEVMAKSNSSAYSYKVTGVRIGKPISKGTFNFETADSDASWTLGTDKTNYEVTYDSDPIELLSSDYASGGVSIMGSDNGNAMLIPQTLTAWDSANDATNTEQGAYLAVCVQITTADGALVYPSSAASVDYDWVAVAIDTEWKAGYKYIYTLDFSNGAGKVDPEKDTESQDQDDPFDPGDDVFDSAIEFTVTVSEWTTETGIDLNM